jgi:hypothetical protein
MLCGARIGKGDLVDLLRLGWVFAIAGAAIGLAELVYFSDGYLPRQWLPIALWAGLPMPMACWLGAKLTRTRLAARILAMGFGVALAFGIFGLWDVTLGPGQHESLNGLIVITVPAYQLAVLAVTLLATWLAGRRVVNSPVSGGSAGRGDELA